MNTILLTLMDFKQLSFMTRTMRVYFLNENFTGSN